jgi:hypothetical protein
MSPMPCPPPWEVQPMQSSPNAKPIARRRCVQSQAVVSSAAGRERALEGGAARSGTAWALALVYILDRLELMAKRKLAGRNLD